MIQVFHQFDVVSDDSDHHFLYTNLPKKKKGSGPDNAFANASSACHKKIMQEWKILEKHLPESIYVRVYEKRIDLLRAVIIGAAGTPYHDGLFFFDIAFPPDYPTRPPMVHYHSFGLRPNPNLYADGRVCLSLLDTWTGQKSERWNPKESTVLQVLISIQALVLNEKPYFNEPGHEVLPDQIVGEKAPMAYNEDVFILSCKSMMYLLRVPPVNFKGFVTAHFRERGGVMLSACRNYAKGHVRVGYYQSDESTRPSPSSSSVDASKKFKGLMVKLYPELVTAFAKAGASLENPAQPLKVEPKKGLAGKFLRIIELLGLKKGVEGKE